MGCKSYRIGAFNYAKQESRDCYIEFSTASDDYVCLCAFPHNWTEQKMDSDDVRSLAILGAAVILASREQEDDRIYIPNDIPAWMRAEVDRVLGVRGHDGLE